MIDFRISTPHQIANSLFNAVIRGTQDAKRCIHIGYYGKYVLLGAHVRVNATRFLPSATMHSIELANYQHIKLVNSLLKQRYGYEAYLPGNYSFFKKGCDRAYHPSEVAFLDQLYGMVGDDNTAILDHAELLVLGCIENSRRAWHNIYSHEIDRASEVLRNVNMGNNYIKELTGIEDFFSVETIETTFKK